MSRRSGASADGYLAFEYKPNPAGEIVSVEWHKDFFAIVPHGQAMHMVEHGYATYTGDDDAARWNEAVSQMAAEAAVEAKAAAKAKAKADAKAAAEAAEAEEAAKAAAAAAAESDDASTVHERTVAPSPAAPQSIAELAAAQAAKPASRTRKRAE